MYNISPRGWRHFGQLVFPSSLFFASASLSNGAHAKAFSLIAIVKKNGLKMSELNELGSLGL